MPELLPILRKSRISEKFHTDCGTVGESKDENEKRKKLIHGSTSVPVVVVRVKRETRNNSTFPFPQFPYGLRLATCDLRLK